MTNELWFDVGIVRYTTYCSRLTVMHVLWFDVGIVRYTTYYQMPNDQNGCGLM